MAKKCKLLQLQDR